MADPGELIRRELVRLATQPARSGRESLAKASALRQLERLGRAGWRLPPCPPDWHPGPPEREELDRWYLKQHPEVRERMWARAHERRRRSA